MAQTPLESSGDSSTREDDGVRRFHGSSMCTDTEAAEEVSPGMQTTIGLDGQMPDTPSAATPTLFVCHGDGGGPRFHPRRRVQETMRAKGLPYEKVVAAHGSPVPFLRKGSREQVRAATGDTKLPALKLADGTVIVHSRAILAWVDEQAAARR